MRPDCSQEKLQTETPGVIDSFAEYIWLAPKRIQSIKASVYTTIWLEMCHMTTKADWQMYSYTWFDVKKYRLNNTGWSWIELKVWKNHTIKRFEREHNRYKNPRRFKKGPTTVISVPLRASVKWRSQWRFLFS